MGMEMASSIKEIETGRSHTKAVLFVAIQPAPRCTSDEAVLMIFPSKWGYQSRNEEKGFLFGVACIRCRGAEEWSPPEQLGLDYREVMPFPAAACSAVEVVVQ